MKWRLPLARTPAEPGFAQAVLPHLDSAYNFARWLVRDPALAEDVVQEAAMRALRHFQTFRGDNSRAWLMQIVRNVALTSLAAQTRNQADPPPEDIPDTAPNPEAALTHRQNIAAMESALLALPPELRECIVLRELEELSYKEIAHITGAPIGTIMSRLARARRTLIAQNQQPEGSPQ